MVPLELIRSCGWPEPELLHAGGDRILGALLHQQGLSPQQYRVGLAINSDEGMRESGAPRRGASRRPGQGPQNLWTLRP